MKGIKSIIDVTENLKAEHKEDVDRLLNTLGALRDLHCNIKDVLDGPGYSQEKLDSIREINDQVGKILAEALPE